MAYTREWIWNKLDEMASDISKFYKGGCINYRGKTTDTKEYYTEVISEWLLEHLELFNQIEVITRQSSYKVEGHDGHSENTDSNREEERIAMAMKRQKHLPLVGEVIDYQTPLKNTKEDKAGKIDLLAYDGRILRILELKEPDSKETMLRCVLEGYTYLKTVNQEKLLSNFGLPSHTVIKACPFVFYKGAQWEEMQQDRPLLKQLMKELDVEPFYVNEDGKKYVVTEE